MIPQQQLLECHERIKPYIHNTPVLSSRLINELIGVEVFFKCENFQRAGAYKMRGATNAILQLSDKERAKGVVTHSSGNFAKPFLWPPKVRGKSAYCNADLGTGSKANRGKAIRGHHL